MNEAIDDLRKFCYFMIVAFFLVCIMFPAMYMGAYELINHVDSSIYARYATDKKFEENIFFNEDIDNRTNVLEQLQNEIVDFEEVLRVQDFAGVILEHQSEVEKIISSNKMYQEYLTSIGSSTEDLIKWSEKMATLDEKILISCLYLTFLTISFVMVGGFGFRKTFYLCAGGIYTVSMLSVFSDGISDYLVANILAVLAKVSSEVFTYNDMEQWKIIFSQTFKESTLTFIIFDTVLQIYQSSKNERIKKDLRYVYFSLEMQCSYLKQFEDESNTYIAKIKIPVQTVIVLCDKNVRECKKKLSRKKLSDAKKEWVVVKCGHYEQLREKLIFICKNCEEYTTKEYISCLREIQWLMYKCDFAVE